MSEYTIRYRITLANGRCEVFDLHLDPSTLELRDDSGDSPAWTRLDFRQCPNCPLSVEDHPDCPAARRLRSVVSRFEHIVSYHKVSLEVETGARRVLSETDAQEALRSLIGLVMATSGCPHTAFFRPMARFHLPLATEEETTFRSVGTYLLAQHFLHKEGVAADIELNGMRAIFERLQVVNASILKRLRAAGRTDSTLNAVISLDAFAVIVPEVMEDRLQEIRAMLEPYLERQLTDSIHSQAIDP